MMLEFNLYRDDPYARSLEVVYINPLHVASVVETERRPMDRGYQSVAVVHLVTGEKHVVYDGARKVASQIRKASNE
jgi:hypothetical protein